MSAAKMKFTPEQQQEMASAYMAGQSTIAISAAWNCGDGLVGNVLKRLNIKPRTRSEAQELRRSKDKSGQTIASKK